jgi:predicted RNase H-like nuclease
VGARVLGVDASGRGWIGIAWGGGEQLWAYAAGTVAAVVAACRDDGPVALVGLDIPIGLSEAGPRLADVAARDRLGARRSSVFETPVRAALLAPDHASAGLANRAATGRGVSAQAYGLRHRVLEVDGWLRADVAGDRPPVYEVHPELSFAQMAGHPLPDGKRTWAGAEHRRMLLAREGLFVGDLGEAGRLALVDDALDAAAAAWTAARILTGDATSLPDPPEPTPDGLAAAIWV